MFAYYPFVETLDVHIIFPAMAYSLTQGRQLLKVLVSVITE